MSTNPGNKGYRWINNEVSQRMVTSSDLQKYLLNGWKLGRLTKDGIPTRIPCKLCGKLISKYDSASKICWQCNVSKGIFKQYWSTPERREEQKLRAMKPRSEKFKNEQSVRISQWYKDNPEQRELRSNAMKQTWESGKITLSPRLSINRSAAENLMYQALKELYGDWGTRNTLHATSAKKWFFPDCIIRDFAIVEYYGSFWHADPTIYSADDIIIDNISAKDIWKQDNDRIATIIAETDIHEVVIIWESETTHLKSVEDWKNYLEWRLIGLDECYSI